VPVDNVRAPLLPISPAFVVFKVISPLVKLLEPDEMYTEPPSKLDDLPALNSMLPPAPDSLIPTAILMEPL
jgi:hypothetical protein